MSGSVFLSGGWSIGSGFGSAVANGAGRRVKGAIACHEGRRVGRISRSSGGVFSAVLAFVGVRTRFQQVDYRNFRESLNVATTGRVHSWGRDTYLYDSRNRLIAIKRAARFDVSGRSWPTSYFVRRPA